MYKYVSENIAANPALNELTWEARELKFTAMRILKIQT
jgi:hypothetical protein